ncbi:hypothetical protein [Pelosinus fermentans]|nr:hypothetical protein [Pelosinus fermentans]
MASVFFMAAMLASSADIRSAKYGDVSTGVATVISFSALVLIIA